MKATCLASSSAGNCYILEFDIKGVPTRIMVECGIHQSEMMKGCNKNLILLSSIQSCLITHFHADHACSSRFIENRMIPIYASKPTLEHWGLNGRVLEEYKVSKIAEGIFVFPFSVEHDADGSMGFVIKTATETVVFINDCRKWNVNLINFKPDYVFIECNYQDKMVYAQLSDLKKQIATEEMNESEWSETQMKIKQHERNIKSHMSLSGCIKGLDKLDLSNCKAIMLMHLSDRFANEYKMKTEVQAHTGIRTYVCGKLGGIK